MMKKTFLALILMILTNLACANETIRFATEATYAPFEFIDSNNTLQGFDIDLANALCDELQASCTFTNQDFDSLIPGLNFRRFDAVIADIDITAERQKLVAFTAPYYQNSALFVGKKGQFEAISQLSGQSVGIQNGTTHQAYLAAKHPDINIVGYGSYQNAILDLKNGRIAAVFGDNAIINNWLEKETNLAVIGAPVTDPDYFGLGVAIAVRKNNHALQEELDQALATIKTNGVYQKIYDKWFPHQ